MDQPNQNNAQYECPICYEKIQKQKIRTICSNSHELCERCLLKLRKRQCPICKKDFRIVIDRATRAYKIFWDYQDVEHNNLAKEEDLQQQRQQLRQYYQAYYQHYGYYPQLQYFPQQGTYRPSPHQRANSLINPGTFDSMAEEELQNQRLRAQTFYLQNDISSLARNPLMRHVQYELIRRQRRQRDREIFLQAMRQQNQQENYQQNQEDKNEKSCNLLAPIGRALVRFGEMLGGDREQFAENGKEKNIDTNEISHQTLCNYPRQPHHQQHSANINPLLPITQWNHYYPHAYLQPHRNHLPHCPHAHYHHHPVYAHSAYSQTQFYHAHQQINYGANYPTRLPYHH